MNRTIVTIAGLFLVLVLACACATTGGSTQSTPSSELAPAFAAGSFTISLGETKSVFVSKQGEDLLVQRIENGERKEPNVIVFRYFGDANGEILTVSSNIDVEYLTYDCYQMVGSTARQTSIMGVMKGVRNSMEMWSDGVKTLRIQNIRIVK